MSRRPTPAAVLAGSPDEVEARLYEALRQGDLERVMALWADDDEIVCVRPGGVRAIGAAAVRSSFEALLAHGGVRVQAQQVHRLQQHGCALHHLVEHMEVSTEAGPQSSWVLATNFYIRTAQGWRLASHHASAGPAQPLPAPDGDGPATLH